LSKPEPLTKEKKLKHERWDFGCDFIYDKKGWLLDVEDVKSAVNWLLKETNKAIDEWAEEGGSLLRLRLRIMNLIKKTFSGVIEE